MKWTIHPIDQLDRFESAWRNLNGSGVDLPVLDPDYVFNLVKYLGTGRELLAVCDGTGGPAAMAVLTLKKPGVWAAFEAGGCPLGIWISDPSVSLESLVSGLFRALPGIAVLVSLTRRDPDLTLRPRDEVGVRTVDYIRTPRLTLRGTFETYWAARTKNFRQNVKKGRNRLKRDGIESRFVVLTDPDAVANGVDAYGFLESSGWKAETGNALHPTNAQGRFFREMMRLFARRNQALVSQFWIGDQLAASDLFVCNRGVIIDFRTSYNETFKHVSPAELMREDFVKYVYEKGRFEAIEYYGEYINWHKNWADHVRTMYHANYYRWPALARFHQAMPGRAKWRGETRSGLEG
jgi:CelD/BcsL family acetyltransferase involved in cellulose biosynthesis